VHVSIAWVGRQITSAETMGTWLRLLTCDNVATAMDLVTACTQPTLCFVFADRDGHIGMQGCGSIPFRPDPHAGLGPLPAWETQHHWRGLLPMGLLPSVLDPPEGFLATANEEWHPPNGPMIVTQTVHDYRWRRIRRQLAQWDHATLTQMQQLQYDVISVQAEDLLAVILPELPDGWLKERLSRWNGSYAVDDSTAPLFQQLYRYLMMELLGNKRGIGWRRMLYLCSRAGFSSMVLTAADRLLQRDSSWWWQGRAKAEIIRRAAARVVDQPDITWGDVNRFHFVNRFVGNHRVGRLLGYNTRSHAMPGCHATPFQGHVFQTARREATFAPSYHFVTCMGTDEAWTNLPGGPSESRFSQFYRSDIPLWLDGDYKRLAAG
jgi:penicillin amidase